MKTLILVLALLSMSAFAQDVVKKDAPVVPVKHAKAHHATKAQMGEAKTACLTENAELSKDKKALKDCIKTKLSEKK